MLSRGQFRQAVCVLQRWRKREWLRVLIGSPHFQIKDEKRTVYTFTRRNDVQPVGHETQSSTPPDWQAAPKGLMRPPGRRVPS